MIARRMASTSLIRMAIICQRSWIRVVKKKMRASKHTHKAQRTRAVDYTQSKWNEKKNETMHSHFESLLTIRSIRRKTISLNQQLISDDDWNDSRIKLADPLTDTTTCGVFLTRAPTNHMVFVWSLFGSELLLHLVVVSRGTKFKIVVSKQPKTKRRAKARLSRYCPAPVNARKKLQRNRAHASRIWATKLRLSIYSFLYLFGSLFALSDGVGISMTTHTVLETK